MYEIGRKRMKTDESGRKRSMLQKAHESGRRRAKTDGCGNGHTRRTWIMKDELETIRMEGGRRHATAKQTSGVWPSS